MRKVCFITGTRAEYGLLSPMMHIVDHRADMQLQVIATNMHLMPEYGNTYLEIERDGFKIDAKVPMPKPGDTPHGIVMAMAEGMAGISSALEQLKPDIVVLLGDRYEALAAAIACHTHLIPVAHIHGGEITIGATDDAMRHCITKLSCLHFTATAEYRNRVIQLGESPDRVFHVGAPGVENILGIEHISREELEEYIGLDLSKDTILVTYHPVTLNPGEATQEVEQLLHALDAFKDLQVIFTMPNSDHGSDGIRHAIKKYCTDNPTRTRCYKSLGFRRYLSLLPHLKAVVGNSSSGIIEAPSAHILTVDIGDRQLGRTRGESVLHCDCRTDDIVKTIRQALSPEMQKFAKRCTNPYAKYGTAQAIVNTIATYPLDDIIKKRFYDTQ